MPVALLALNAGLAGCSDPEDVFKSGRLPSACDGAWPVCTTTAGCVLGDTLYLEGKFPGTRRFIVRTGGQATITVALYLRSESATGRETRIEFNDAGCGTTAVDAVDGRELFREFDSEGIFQRSRPVYKEGDHLVAVESDATAEYLLRVEVGED